MRKVTTKNTKDTTKKGFDFISFANTTKDVLATTGLEGLQEMQGIIIDQMSSIKDSKLKNKVKTRLGWIDDLIADKEVQNTENINTTQIAMDIINETAITTDSKPVIDKVASKKKTTTKTTKKTTTKKKEESKKDLEKPQEKINKIKITDLVKVFDSGKKVFIRFESEDDEDYGEYEVVHHDKQGHRLVLVQYEVTKDNIDLSTCICDYKQLARREALTFHDNKNRITCFVESAYTK